MIEIRRTYHPNGKLNLEAPMLDGKFHGIVKVWYDNGNLALQKEYRNGDLNGLYIFNSDISKNYRKIQYYIKGKREGEKLLYNSFYDRN